MKIPLPCKLGDVAECNGRELPLKGVSWFKWTKGMEYTYFFETGNKWERSDFYTTFEYKQPYFFEISDSLLKDTFIKEHGYPLAGSGYVYGLNYIDGKTYIEFIITTSYFAHIKVQCNKNAEYVNGGNIIFPVAWSEEKKEKAILKSFKSADKKTSVIKPSELVQLSLFDFL